jgi:UDP-N-acetylmuramate dehydrogenase
MNMADAFHLREPMARHVSWRAGGPADRFFVPHDLAGLCAFLRSLPADEALLFVGLGSNLLVRDGGFRGTVVLTHQARLAPQLRGGLVYAEAGVASPKVARFAALHHLSGAEFMAGIPGTVGGALAMNAGCYGSETWDIVARAVTVDRGGEVRERPKSDFEIAYRHCRTPGEEWFVAGYFALQPGDGDASRRRIKELLARRIATQPLQLPNAGSVFRNPPGDHAARLIEACGLKGLQRGGARVSEKHANFIVNPHGAARAADIEGLILEVKKVVFEKTGVELLPEVRIVGEPA